MAVPCIDAATVLAALEKRDPETLVGPVLCLLTWLARDASCHATERAGPIATHWGAYLVAHLGALAAHPAVSLEVRLAAGALAIEHRGAQHGAAPIPRQ